VLVKELQSLCLDVRVLDKDGEVIELKDDEDDDFTPTFGSVERDTRRDERDREFAEAGFSFEDEEGNQIEPEYGDEPADSDYESDDMDGEEDYE